MQRPNLEHISASGQHVSKGKGTHTHKEGTKMWVINQEPVSRGFSLTHLIKLLYIQVKYPSGNSGLFR